MKKLLVVLLATLMVLSLTGCGDKKEAAEQKLSMSIGGEPHYLDPVIASDNVSMIVLQQMYYGLFELDEGGNVVKTGCADYSISNDGLVYTFKIKDMKWSNGDPVTAENFVYGIKRSVGYGSGESYYSYFITDYVVGARELEGKDVADMDSMGVKVIDEKTFEITLIKPVAFFPSLMTMGVFYPVHPAYAKEHDSLWADSTDVPVNGPFVPTKINLVEEIVMKKNDNFINADKVSLSEITIKIMPDMDAELLAFQSGEIDFAAATNDSVVKLYAGKPELVYAGSVINYYFYINSADFTTAKALRDVNVRQALLWAVDREQLVEVMDAGDIYNPLYGYVPIGIPGISSDFRLEQDKADQLVGYDQAKAIELLKTAGYSVDKPLKLVYYYNQNAMHDAVSANLQAQYKQVGIELTLKTADIRTFFDDRDSNGKYELARGAMSADFMDPTTFLDMLASWAQQKVIINDAKYDGLLKAAQDELDPKARMELLHEAENYLIGEMAYVCPLFYYDKAYLVKDGVVGVGYDPTGNIRLAYAKIIK